MSALALSAFTLLASADDSPSPAVVAKSLSNVPTAKADAVDASDFPCTVSPQFNDMPGMSETFTQGGTLAKPVIVLSQGEFFGLAEGAEARIRLTIDGVVPSGPLEIVVKNRPTGDQSTIGAHGFNFISDPLAPGTHTARIRSRDNGGGPGCVNDRSLIILHK